MSHHQAGILEPIPKTARYLAFSQWPGGETRRVLQKVAESADGRETVVGIGVSLVAALKREIPGLRVFPGLAGPGVDVPSTQDALWCWLRGGDRGELVHRTRYLARALAPALRLERVVDAFSYRTNLDLSGYEDGTENPTGDAAVRAALVAGSGPGLDGSSFVAAQQWEHDLDRFDAFSPERQDEIIGRRRSDNVEIEDAPASAHVKRTAQESFDPPAFVLRRSMPWADGRRAGFMFVAFGKTLDAFEVQMRRMAGGEDGVVDGLFGFTRPRTGGYFWCPPVAGGRLDLGALGF